MNKQQALERLTAIESETKELRAIIDAPEGIGVSYRYSNNRPIPIGSAGYADSEAIAEHRIGLCICLTPLRGIMMYIYSVATMNKIHTPCCKGFNYQHEMYRTRVAGVFFDKKNAEQDAKNQGDGYFVEKHKIRDANYYVTYGE